MRALKLNSLKSYSFLIKNNHLGSIRSRYVYVAIKIILFIFVSIFNVAIWTVLPLIILVIFEQFFPLWLSELLLYIFIFLLAVAVFESFRVVFIALRYADLKEFDDSIPEYIKYVNDKLDYALNYRKSGGRSPLPILSFVAARVNIANFLRSQSPDFRKRNIEYGFIYLYLLISVFVVFFDADDYTSVYSVFEYTLYMLYEILNTISFDIPEIFFERPDINYDQSQKIFLQIFGQICFTLGIVASASRNIDILLQRNVVLHTNFFGLRDYIENSFLSTKLIDVYFLGVPSHYNFQDAQKLNTDATLLQANKKASQLSRINLVRIFKDKSFESAWLQPQQAEFDDLVVEKLSRNALCPCGSGKRYKHCHGSNVGP